MIIKTNEQGYNYKYTDLAGIHKTLETLGLSYQQETRTEPSTQDDYIWTRVFDKDNKVIIDWTRGAMVVRATLSGKTNPVQEYGASLTYARRYSLMMTLGIATEDDDAKSLDGAKKIVGHMKPVENVEHAIVDNAGAEKITAVQNDKILKLLGQKDVLLDDLAHFKVDNLSKLTKKQADQYIKVLETRRAKENG